jgi:hypothetical protein
MPPVTIAVPESLECYPLAFTASGTYDARGYKFDPAPVDPVTYTVYATLTIPQGLGSPDAVYEGEYDGGTTANGNWHIDFTVEEEHAGTNATLAVELWTSADEEEPLAANQVTNFDVLGLCPVDDDDGIGGPLGGVSGSAGKGSAAATTTEPKFQFFFGGYQPDHSRVECVIERRFVGDQRIVSGNRAEMNNGRWAVVLFVPEPNVRAEDWLMVTWYALGGVAVKWSERQIA